MNLVFAAVLGVLLDRLFGEPRRWHPLVGFGRLAAAAERTLRWGAPGHASGHPIGNRLRGLIAWCAIVLPFVAFAVWLAHPLSDVLLLWFALGGRSLGEHAHAIAGPLGASPWPLAAGDLAVARARVACIVSRDTSQLDETGVAKATIESVLENGNDAVFGALFWFCIAGGAGALLYRLANTLDAMWGYKDERRVYFGWAAARLDDLLNFVPARLTALTYALLGDARTALACWHAQAGRWSSPNAGPVMAAGAGALGVTLGGAAVYHGRVELRERLGVTEGNSRGIGGTVTAADISRAVALVERGQWLWLAVFALWSLARA